MVQRQPQKTVWKTLSQKKKKSSQKWAGGVAHGVGPEFNPQYHKNKQTNNKNTPKHQLPRNKFIAKKKFLKKWGTYHVHELED
jgi:hypothetical protein